MQQRADAHRVGERRIRERSLWLEQVDEPLTPRPGLDGDLDVDVAVVGAGFTGLWTALHLLRADPSLRLVVLEREVAGFGASGRNGGWVMGRPPGDPERFARRRGRDAVLRAARAVRAAVGQIGAEAEREGIDCDFRQGGALIVATSPPQADRQRARIERLRAFGHGPDDLCWLDAEETGRRVRVAGAIGASFTPHSARVHPARLARGLARAVERAGGRILEQTPVDRIEARRAVTTRGTVRAEHVVRATEAFTIELPGQRRTVLPLTSLMVATEPLGTEVWQEIGWDGGETVEDARHLFAYSQRTADGRIAIGGRGAPYRLGSALDERDERDAEIHGRLRETIARLWPAAAGARITHRWGGVIAVPRDWCPSVGLDRASGLAWAGGYAGQGVTAAYVMGRTLADLITGADSDLTTLPWVDHRSRHWEPEPLRWLAARAIVRGLQAADEVEEREGRPSRRARAVQRFLGAH